ncbi:MAG: pyridoxal 5'-phosphate synthase lyase subunit PdxS [Candidatus Marinimicrobia bacterium]|nr:pyridoxal 5'-phosphate synthase lyase subunit PdxS [Candidatus Neomarinimicrobiota bacterium]|tara:strand:+ start:851 stop:1732 length:882 start_codon:yes stop_codon:yes gene_type:complete
MSNGPFEVKIGLAEMLKGGVIMDVTNHEQAIIAEDAGACAVMALERIPSDIRKDGGISRMSDPEMIKEIQKSVSIPVMAKCRIGHFTEAQVLESLEIDFIDESEVLTPADEHNHVWKHDFKVPFVCGCRNLGEALRRIAEGAALIRTKGEAGSGNIVEAVRHMRTVVNDIKRLTTLGHDQLVTESKNMGAPLDLVLKVSETGKLPVPNFAAGGIATPADAALMMQLGAETVFVGSGIFKSEDPASRAKAVVEATTNYQDPEKVLEASTGLKSAMKGLDMSEIPEAERLQERGW